MDTPLVPALVVLVALAVLTLAVAAIVLLRERAVRNLVSWQRGPLVHRSSYIPKRRFARVSERKLDELAVAVSSSSAS